MAFGVTGGLTTTKSETDTRSRGSEQGVTRSRRLDEAQIQELSRTMRGLQRDVEEEDERYGKSAAIADTKGIVNQIFQDYRETTLPDILSQQSAAGAYSSTGTQLLANDAFARTTNQASATVLQAISEYAGIQDQRRQTASNALSNVLQGILASREDTSYSTLFDTSSQSKAKGTTKKISGGFSVGG